MTIVTTMLRERLSSTWAPPKVPNVRRLFASDASSTHLATHRALPAKPLLQTEGAELSRQSEYAHALQMPPFSQRHFHAPYFRCIDCSSTLAIRRRGSGAATTGTCIQSPKGQSAREPHGCWGRSRCRRSFHDRDKAFKVELTWHWSLQGM